MMSQSPISQLQQEVWCQLHQIFNRYTSNQAFISSEQLQLVIRQILQQESPRQIDYVLNNLCKIDTDSNGLIDFPEFANFLLKRHCGELALQKMHYNNKISQGKDRKIAQAEFRVLLDKAYAFLGVRVGAHEGDALFKGIDSDRDGFITYVEYFTFIDQYLCKYKHPVGIPTKLQPSGPTAPSQLPFKSRFRNFIWFELRKVYQEYDKDKSNTLDAEQIEKIMLNFIKDTNKDDIDYILFKVLRVSSSRTVKFPQFAAFILKYMIEVHLSRFYRLHGTSKRKINRQDFVVIIKTALSFLPISRVTVSLLFKFFDVIDTDNDGWISNKEIISWVQAFLCPEDYSGRSYYLQEDDQNFIIGKNLILPAEAPLHIQPSQLHKPVSSIATTISSHIRPSKYSCQQLAIKVRKQVYLAISKYDLNNNKLFEQDQISNMLQGILKETKHQIRYVLMNVFRYDKDGDRKITYDEIADFLLEMHSGEMAIQRMHLNETYKRGAERIMDLMEFVLTVNYALSFFGIEADEASLRQLFFDIDQNGDGWITYQEYFQFLRQYFGSQSEVAKSGFDKYQQAVLREANLIQSNDLISYQEKLRKLYKLQTEFHLFKFDANKNRLLEKDEITNLLATVFGYKQSQLAVLLPPLFQNSSNCIAFQAFWAWMTNTNFNFSLTNFLSINTLIRKNQQMINFSEFTKITEYTFGFSLITLRQDQLEMVFKIIDSDSDGWITFKQWKEYINKIFGINLFDKVLGENNSSLRETRKNARDNPNNDGVRNELWGQLRKLYDHYDASKNNNMTRQCLQLFCKQILQQTEQKQLSYVIISLLSPSKSNPPTVSFEQFAPFILNYAIETSMKRFHIKQTPGKEHFSKDQFYQVLRNAFNFVKLKDQYLAKTFQKLDRNSNGQVPYTELMSWVYFDIAKKIR